jgi:glycosyltransferase involved in cell wall biosynthesis
MRLKTSSEIHYMLPDGRAFVTVVEGGKSTTRAVPPPRVSVVIPSRNEALVQATVDSFKADGADEIIVIDDGQTIESIKDAVLLKTDKPQGPSFCRNLGAEKATGDVLIFSDAHVAVEKDTVVKLASIAISSDTVVCAAIKSMAGSGWVGYGGTLQPMDAGYESRYNLSHGRDNCTSLIGSVYAVTKKAFDEIGGWPPTLSFGYNEQAFSMAVLFSGRMVYAAKAVAAHKFKGHLGYHASQHDANKNRVIAHWLLFSEKEFELTWKPKFQKHLARAYDACSNIFTDSAWLAVRKHFQDRKKITDEQFYAVLRENGGAREVRVSPPVSLSSVAVFTAFAAGREKLLEKYRSVMPAGIGRLVVGLDNDRSDVCEAFPQATMVRYAEPKANRQKPLEVSTHLAHVWNETIDSKAFDGSKYVLSWEDDVVPEPGFLPKMMAAMKPGVGIVSLPVRSRQGHLMVYGVTSVDPFRLDWKNKLDGKTGVQEVGSVSLSCALIRKSLLDYFRFTAQPNGDSGGCGHEWCLMKRCNQLSLKILCCFDVTVAHVNGTPIAMPSTIQLAANAAKAAGRVAVAAVTGDELKVTEEIFKKREGICQPCERRVSKTNRCAHAACGCHLQKKQRLATEHCPDAKW